MLGTILIVVLIFALLGSVPRWGNYPTGGVGSVLLIVNRTELVKHMHADHAAGQNFMRGLLSVNAEWRKPPLAMMTRWTLMKAPGRDRRRTRLKKSLRFFGLRPAVQRPGVFRRGDRAVFPGGSR
jgi:Protein of unknown function (DUF3309)